MSKKKLEARVQKILICFFRMRGYLSSDAPLVNEYPGISRIEQSAISEEVYRRNSGEYVDYIFEFHRRMRALMEERGLLYSVALGTETSDSVQGPPWGTEFKNEIERKIWVAKLHHQEIEFVYFSFGNGSIYISVERATPVLLRYEDAYWVMVGKDKNDQRREYIVRLIYNIDDEEVEMQKQYVSGRFLP